MNCTFQHYDNLEKDTSTIVVGKNIDYPSDLFQPFETERLHQKEALVFDRPFGLVGAYRTDKIGEAGDEQLRRYGAQLAAKIKEGEIDHIQLIGGEDCLSLIEGLVLSLYRFDKYLSDKKDFKLSIAFPAPLENRITELGVILEGVCHARDLVNEPPNKLSATQYSLYIENLAKDAGFKLEVLNKAKIESLQMGGVLAVNAGSSEPPTFNILEWKPEEYVLEAPIVLVGKGVVYDTGGLSLKPTPNSMDFMKADMGGSAAVVGAIYSIAKNKLPIHVVGLIPATDNRLGENSFSPGDVIKMYSGNTVEVLNTDAEGRLILADALHYAKKYKPELVIDLATLTGAAARAIGKDGVVYMGNAGKDYKTKIEESGMEVYERLVEFPLWEEYDEQIKSDIADFTNLGGPEGGAITAGKFLQRFVDYEWLHLDIAGPAFLKANDHYRVKGGTGTGVRLLYRFISKLISSYGK